MPDVFILGFTKSATTSMYNQLMQHDRVSQTRRKEPHFHFSRVLGSRFEGPADQDTVAQMFVTERDRYLGLYQPGKLSIDGSAMSIEDPRIVESIDQQFPRAKFIIMLRDPVERAFSAYSHLVRDARETRAFRQAIDHELSGARGGYLPIWRYIGSSRYVDAVQHARRLLRDRLKIVAYRDYARNNRQTMDGVARFIGLQPIQWRCDLANRSGIPRSPLLQKALMRQSIAKSLFVSAFPEKMVNTLKRGLLERNTGQKPSMSDDDRRYFQSVIADETGKIDPDSPDSPLLQALYAA